MADALILLTNDDGIDAEGLRVLAEAAGEFGEVLTVAPRSEMSAISHAITLHTPLRVMPMGPGRYAVVNGTPADCIYLALNHLLDRTPTLVLSGINHGTNLGFDVIYSGTVAGARQAVIQGIPGVALSFAAGGGSRVADVRAHVIAILHEVIERGLAENTLLNVNIPSPSVGPIRGFRVTTLGRRIFSSTVESRVDPRGAEYLWIAGRQTGLEGPPESDVAALREGYVSMTPLQLDTTAHSGCDALREWGLVKRTGAGEASDPATAERQ